MRSDTLRKRLIVGALLPVSFILLYVAWYFIVMRDDLEYFLVFKNAFSSGPDYLPSIIVGLTIMSFFALWLITGIVMIIWVLKGRRRRAASA